MGVFGVVGTVAVDGFYGRWILMIGAPSCVWLRLRWLLLLGLLGGLGFVLIFTTTNSKTTECLIQCPTSFLIRSRIDFPIGTRKSESSFLIVIRILLASSSACWAWKSQTNHVSRAV